MYLNSVLDTISKKRGSFAAEDLYKLNEAIFNLPEDNVVNGRTAQRLFKSLQTIRTAYTGGKHEKADPNFFYDYVALLATMQNQHFFNEKQHTDILSWLLECLSKEVSPPADAKGKGKGKDKLSKADQAKVATLEKENKALKTEVEKLRKVSDACAVLFNNFKPIVEPKAKAKAKAKSKESKPKEDKPKKDPINVEETSQAFVFIKPHAVTDEVKTLVKKKLAENGIKVVKEGAIKAEKIDKAQLIDTHYGAIASKAMKQKPDTLTVQQKAQDEFKGAFGMEWSEALSKGLVFNAVDGCTKLDCDFDGLNEKWGTLKKGVNLLKFGGGFYCGKVGDIFVINGFYMDMRKAFTQPGTCIYYFKTEWATKDLCWGDFRGKVLGGTDPKTADAGSLRNLIFNDWEALKLKAVPNTGDNGVHASASPFEALAERANWLRADVKRDAFGRAMLAKGVKLEQIKAWTDDPPVNFEGNKQSLFDLLEDLDGKDCLEKSAKISTEN